MHFISFRALEWDWFAGSLFGASAVNFLIEDLVLGLSKTYFGGLNDVESWKQGMKRG
jgi:hypothetical protein